MRVKSPYVYLDIQQALVHEINGLSRSLSKVAVVRKIAFSTVPFSVVTLMYLLFLDISMAWLTFILALIYTTIFSLVYKTKVKIEAAILTKRLELDNNHEEFVWYLYRYILVATSRAKINICTAFRNKLQEEFERSITLQKVLHKTANGKYEIHTEKRMYFLFKDVTCVFEKNAERTGVWNIARLTLGRNATEKSRLWLTQSKDEKQMLEIAIELSL